MFPNPVDRNSQVSINLNNVSADGAIITITDLNGKVLYNDILRSTTNSLNLGKLNSGLYIVKVINGNEQYNAKLVVR
jgi:riboflavin synthase alpha subunit